MRSMTGFGRGAGRTKAVQIAVEVKTVNHKFHDVSIKVPASYQFLEPEIRELILSSVSRGKVDFFMKDLSPVRPKTVEVNENLLREYLRAAKKAAEHFKLKSDLSTENLLRMPDVLMVAETERSEAEQRQAALEAVRQSLKALEKMRQLEGARLGKDMLERAKEISNVIQNIRLRHKTTMAEKVKSFKEKVAEFLPEPLQDQMRLATEEGLLLQRHDISEELTRLDSHLEALQQSLKEKESVGRRLDFLIQEMNREINTIGSKSADSKMAQSVVRLKELLEQLREQIQNIE